jgi:recombination DNA repair RAD52 pathway protein
MSETLTEREALARELWPHAALAPEQIDALLRPLNSTRVAKRTVSGKELSYLESWDVKRCLIRVFGFGGFDSEVVNEELIGEYPYTNSSNTAMLEIVYRARVRLTVRDQGAIELATYTEGAVGSATVRADSGAKGDAHDNALKTAASDALKRCAINLGTQFGLSLYDNGSRSDVVGNTLVNGRPPAEPTEQEKQAQDTVADKLGATPVEGS